MKKNDLDPRPLDEYMEEEKVLYVFNRSQPKGRVVITITPPYGGDKYRLVIPKTDIPFNVYNEATPVDIKNSRDFRKLLESTQIIQLCKPSAAERILNTAEGRYETNKLRTKKSKYVQMLPDEEDVPKDDIEIDQLTSLNVEARMLIDRFKSGDLKVRELHKELKKIEDNLKEEDFGFILEHCNAKLISNWASDRMEIND